MPSPNLILMGPRASGKTTIGRAVAVRLGLPFVDLDDRTRARFDETSVHAIWARHGEAGWRAAEWAALQEVLEAAGQVIALGGGTPTIEAARERLRRLAADGKVRCVYLEVPAETLITRLQREGGDRPRLAGMGATIGEEVLAVLAARGPVYRELADLVIPVGALDATIARVAEAYQAVVEGGAGEEPGIRSRSDDGPPAASD